MSRFDTRHRAPRFGRLMVIVGLLVPLFALGTALAGTRQFLVILGRSPKEIARSGPRVRPLPQDIQDQYFDEVNPQIMSFAEYWEEISYGDIRISGKTTDWIDLPWLIKVPGPDMRRIDLRDFTTAISSYGIGEAFSTFAPMVGVAVGPAGVTPDFAKGSRDTVPGKGISVWMPGERFVDLNGNGRWDGLDEANNTMDFFINDTVPLKLGADGLADLKGPWVDLNGNGVPDNAMGCVFLPDSDNDGNPDCCPNGPGKVGCEAFSPGQNNSRVCPPTAGDCNGNRIPDACDVSCTSAACLATGWLNNPENRGKCGGSEDKLPTVQAPGSSLCTGATMDGIPDECQFNETPNADCGTDPQDPSSSDQCTSSLPQCKPLIIPRTPRIRCEYDDANGNGQLDIVEPFENFLRRWDVASSSWIKVSNQYVLDNYPGDASKLLSRGETRPIYGKHDPLNPGGVCTCPSVAPGSPETPCETKNIMVNGLTISLTKVCPAGEHAQYEPPDRWTERGSSKMYNPDGFITAVTREPAWYKQAWVDRYGTTPPPWGSGSTPAMRPFTAFCVGGGNDGLPCNTDSDCPGGQCSQAGLPFRADRGGVNGRGTGWVGCDGLGVGTTFASSATFRNWGISPCNDTPARILPEELNGIGRALVLFDGPVEHDDLPSSKYHRAGDKRLGEATSPFTDAIWGQDRGANIPNRFTLRDDIIEPGGPYAIHVHGNFGRDAGNVLYMEMLTWRTSPPFNNGAAWKEDTRFDDRLGISGSVNHRFAFPENANIGFRDYNLNGMVDQGSVVVGARDTYQGGPLAAVPVGFEASRDGTHSPYPWNRRRLLEDTTAILDDVIDFDDFVDTVSLDRLACSGQDPSAGVPSWLAGASGAGTIKPAGVLSGIVLLRDPTCQGGPNDGLFCTIGTDCPSGICLGLACAGGANAGQRCNLPNGCPGGSCVGLDAGDFPLSPSFQPIHNEDGLGDPAFLSENLPQTPRDAALEPGFEPRISWNLFAHDLVKCLDCGSRFSLQAVQDFQTAYAAHEYLHAWEGFPDLYDYDVFDNPLAENCPAGVWDIMARGGLVHPAPILKEKRCTEWVKPVDLAGLLTPGVDTVLTLPPAEFVRDKSYYFLENDNRLGERYYFWSAGLGFDTRLPGAGMLVMHTDVGSNQEALPQGQRSGDRPAFLIVQADGRNELQACRTGGDEGDAGDIWPGSTNATRFNFDTLPPATWFSQNSWTGIDVLDVEPDTMGSVRLTLNWVPTSIPSLRFVDPPGGVSVGTSFQVRFKSTDVFGGTNIKLFFIPDQKTCSGNRVACDKNADCPSGEFCRYDTALTGGAATRIGSRKKTNPGTADLSINWNISGVADGRYVIFARLAPGVGADGTEEKSTKPRPGRGNKGNGGLHVSHVAINDNGSDADDVARLETWTALAIDANGTTWRVNSTLSQPVINESDPNQDPWPKATTGQPYASANGAVRFTINAGSKPFELGDTFTFTTTGITAPSAAVTVINGIITDDPVARITALPLAGDPPLFVSFDGRSSIEPNSEPLTYRWDFGDGSPPATGATTSHTFSKAGTFTVVLGVTNPRNRRSGEAAVDIEVINNSPKAMIAADPTSGRGPLQVRFNAGESSDRETSATRLIYQWDFGDGFGANDARVPGAAIQVQHTYRNRADGTPCTPTNVCMFTVGLTVTDEGGKQDTATATIIVGNSNPVANVTVLPRRGSVPLEVRFDASGSTDADGDTLTVDWVWGDGKQTPDQPLAGPDGDGIVKHTYEAEGLFRPTATIKDPNGGSAVWPGVDITVTAPVAGSSDPRAIFQLCAQSPCNTTDPALPVLNKPFAVDASQSVDRPAGGSITAYSWDWGDGSPTDSGVTATHTYTTAGTFTMTLTVTDAETPPNTGRFSRIVVVEEVNGGPEIGNEPPTPFFVVDPPNGVASETEFRFDASGSNDPDGDNAKLTYGWKFGDGAEGAGRVVRHLYAAPNASGYVVRLTVRDEKNASRSLTNLVVVTETSGNRRPEAIIGTGPRSGSAPFTLALDASNSFDPDGDPLEFRWEFREMGEVIDVLAGATVTRVFSDAGTFEVELRVSDGRGGVAFAGPQMVRVTPRVAPPAGNEPGQGVPVENGPAEIPGSAGQRPPSICGVGMLMAMIGSLVGLTLMVGSRRRRR